jgi:GGDEF domain-containing protein
MVRESLSRYWVVSGCGDAAVTDFARRLGDAVAAGPGHLGVPLTASIGFTLVDAPGGTCSKSGPDAERVAAELCERAEEAMLSARAAGAGIDSR